MVKDSLSVKEWIRFAQNDFEDALILANRFKPHIEGVCFHCHESAEKILKAYIIAQTNSPVKRNHNLGSLLNGCRQYSTDFDNIKKNCSSLEPYIGLGRYPAVIELIEYNMRQALKDTSQILEFTKSKLKDLGYELPPDMSAPLPPDKPENI